MNNVETGKRIRKFAAESSYSVKEIANATGVTIQTVYRWYKGERIPNHMNMDKICLLLGKKRDDLFVF